MIKIILSLLILLVILIIYTNYNKVYERYESFKKNVIILDQNVSNPNILCSGNVNSLHYNYSKVLKNFIPLINNKTLGSIDNIEKLINNKCNLAITRADVITNYFKKNISMLKNKFKLISVLFYENPLLVVKANSNINSWKDLKGKNIGVYFRKNGSKNIFINLIELYDIENSDVNIIELDVYNLEKVNNYLNNKNLDGIFYMIENPNKIIYNISNNNIIKIIGIDNIDNNIIKSRFLSWKKTRVYTGKYILSDNKYYINSYHSPVYLISKNSFQPDKAYKILKTILSNRYNLINSFKNKFYKYVLENITPSDHIGFSKKNIIDYHDGSKQFLKEIGMISYNKNKKCYLYAGSGICNETYL